MPEGTMYAASSVSVGSSPATLRMPPGNPTANARLIGRYSGTASEGSWLHVPDVVIGTAEELEQEGDTTEYPASFFCRLRSSGDRPVVGKESGYLHLTRAGYAHFRSEFQQLSGAPFEQLDREAEAHFQRVERARQRYIADLQAKLAQLESFHV